MSETSIRPTVLLGLDLADVELPDEVPPSPEAPRDVAALVAATPLGRRIRAVRRAVEEEVTDLFAIVDRLVRVPDDRGLPAYDRMLAATLTIEALERSGHLLRSRGRKGESVVYPGPRCWPSPLNRDLALTHGAVGLDVGAHLLMVDPLDLWDAAPDGVSTRVLVPSVLQAAAVVGRLDLEEVASRLQGQLNDGLGPDHGHGAWLDGQVAQLEPLLVEDLGYLRTVEAREGGLPVVEPTALGLLATLLLIVAASGEVPEELATLLVERSHLLGDGGLIDPSDLPSPISLN